MAAKNTKSNEAEIQIPRLEQSIIRLRIVGTTPLFQNKMSAKVKQQLLVGSRKKTAAEKTRIKHAPTDEFRDSAETLPEPGPTALGLRTMAIKKAMRVAALETEGVKGTQVDRLIFIPGDFFPLYGVPLLRMDVMRSADIGKTPDIRTRAFLPTWGAELELHYVTPSLSASSVVTLLCNAGALVGVGDSRQEKGKGSFGAFRVLGEGQQDDEWDKLVSCGERDAQLSALKDPAYAGPDTASLMAFYAEEVNRRK